jgi:nitric oxide reductase subunit C
MKTPTGRRNLLCGLVVVFGVQTGMVYLDGAGRRTPPLSQLAAAGQDIWHRNNCQSCHQRYGFGGFLGPDLTNATERLPRERFDLVLTEGSSPMPAFHFSKEQIDAIEAYLREIDQTGVGQFRLAIPPPVAELLDGIIQTLAAERPLGPAAAAGLETVKSKKCIGCHLPNLQSTLRAPDLCGVLESPGRETVLETIGLGRATRGMPRFELSDTEKEDILAFLEWLRANAEDVRAEFEAAAKTENPGVPWFEYGR